VEEANSNEEEEEAEKEAVEEANSNEEEQDEEAKRMKKGRWEKWPSVLMEGEEAELHLVAAVGPTSSPPNGAPQRTWGRVISHRGDWMEDHGLAALLLLLPHATSRSTWLLLLGLLFLLL